MKTHLFLGVGLSAFLSSMLITNFRELPLFVLLGSISAILPDMDMFLAFLNKDTHRSVLSHSIGSSLLIGVLVLLSVLFLEVFNRPVVPSSAVVPLFIVCAAGAFSHVASDALTTRGVILFWPFSKRRFAAGVKYDDFLPNAFFTGLGFSLLALGVYNLIRLKDVIVP